MREMNLASQYFVAVQSVIAPHSFLHRASSCFPKFLLASTGSEERHPFSFWHQNWVIRGTLKHPSVAGMTEKEDSAKGLRKVSDEVVWMFQANR
jgi:hypothetical protein